MHVAQGGGDDPSLSKHHRMGDMDCLHGLRGVVGCRGADAVSGAKITVRCIACKSTKVIGREQRDMPICDRCYMPMIAEQVTT